jgi:hypothetical protein
MTHPTRKPAPAPAATEHRLLIEAALDQWWTTTDPAQPFHIPAVAEQVETRLNHAGYRITPDTPRTPVPTRRDIAIAALLALICCIGSVYLAARHDWWWAAIGAIPAGLLTREAIRDFTDRRNAR